jgi:nicotinamide-nucleotide amidase
VKATLLSIGDELLIGQTVNTNAVWMSQQLNAIGVAVAHMVTLSDNEDDIIEELKRALEQTDIVLITGGLGPTSDDLTLPTLCKFFNSKRVFDAKVMQNIDQIFSLRKRAITEETKQLAYVPHNAEVIYNLLGTAPGTLFREGNKMVASMPGVPYEMKGMMENHVLPYIQKHYDLPLIIHRNIMTAGVGETQLAGKLVDFEKELPDAFKLAYLPGVGKVKLRISASGKDKTALEQEMQIQFAKAFQAVEKYAYGVDEELLEAHIGKLLLEHQLKLGLAESCTGGSIGEMITSIPGSSRYFNGGIISYANEIKQNVLGVPSVILEQHGAVSEETVSYMLDGALKVLNADIAIAVSGVAGPDGGSPEKPVGTVYIGVGSKDRKLIKRFSFTNHRERNIQISGIVALVLLRNFILNKLAD